MRGRHGGRRCSSGDNAQCSTGGDAPGDVVRFKPSQNLGHPDFNRVGFETIGNNAYGPSRPGPQEKYRRLHDTLQEVPLPSTPAEEITRRKSRRRYSARLPTHPLEPAVLGALRPAPTGILRPACDFVLPAGAAPARMR
ncbi:hypothetical protein GUJ93_ZPchr0001g30709 [Zizania palustris]|uniref:Uncharacterized protein n=1 Tax=Zizania palustris TaxID=103762 RepID=A0A8J5RTE7_ZIZPA|nr:hypothetical protein GUJ93_ZPchr0001g30709 [Zizania palustris]